jgi:hypothetical protein
MAKGKKKLWLILCLAALIAYILLFPNSIPEETVLSPRWISSLESSYPIQLSSAPAESGGYLFPFSIGDRFGYAGEDGTFQINHIRQDRLAISQNYWAEYEAIPSGINPSPIHIMNHFNEVVFSIENPKGYPFILDNRVFIVGSEQNTITAFGEQGEELWSYDFPATITCVDAANGFLLAGTLNGEALLLNSSGNLVFAPFEPGGSSLPVILGCAISRDASRLAIVSGIGEQRFLLLERAAASQGAVDSYNVVYHEFLGPGFRRPLHVLFVDNDSKVVFEREGGIGIYTIGARNSVSLSLAGEIAAVEESNEGDFLFMIISGNSGEKFFTALRYSAGSKERLFNIPFISRPAGSSPVFIVNHAPFISENIFLFRREKRLYIGGDLSLASLELEKR